MCVSCLKEGGRCESENHFLHIVRWWKGQGGLDAANMPPLIVEEDDLVDDLEDGGDYWSIRSEPEDLEDRSPRPSPREDTVNDSITGLGLRDRISKATAEFLKSAWDSD
jgi:hypothetical protein